MAVETLRASNSTERFKPEKKAAKWFLVGGFVGAIIGGVPAALLGSFGAGGISWYQARYKNRQ